MTTRGIIIIMGVSFAVVLVWYFISPEVVGYTIIFWSLGCVVVASILQLFKVLTEPEVDLEIVEMLIKKNRELEKRIERLEKDRSRKRVGQRGR